MAKRLSIEMSEIRSNLARFDGRANDAIAKVFEFQKGASEAYMRSNAPWTDRTTNARNGLFSKSLREGDSHLLVLSHGVSYGIFLETMQAGKYGIIVPAWIKTSDDLWRMLSKLFALMDGG